MIDAPWAERLPPPVRDETDMLDFAASPVEPGSRLSCQLRIEDDAVFDGFLADWSHVRASAVRP